MRRIAALHYLVGTFLSAGATLFLYADRMTPAIIVTLIGVAFLIWAAVEVRRYEARQARSKRIMVTPGEWVWNKPSPPYKIVHVELWREGGSDDKKG